MYNLNSLVKLIVVLLLSSSCSERISDSQDELGCLHASEVIKTATNAKGMIMKMEKEGKTIWYILSMEGVIGQETPTYDTRDLVIPCSLHSDFRKEGELVRFSGNLALYGKEFIDMPHVFLGALSDIEFIENELSL
ncbi:hypothetical protein [Algoriphagus sp. NG3]|uniref:hypothetical protein n=1 Tax=Algoriphagus sp. NG3 TaxID=3097546 RepID=UPI002A81A7BC|nr:hypothetical protein [Algoriphagus sp. NG3]WPR75518.1 hypothetical protein SLW71_22960 [Algoriphagus sp. NG3]